MKLVLSLILFADVAFAQVPNAKHEQLLALTVGNNQVLPTGADILAVRKVNLQNQSTDTLTCSFAVTNPSPGTAGFMLRAASSPTSGDGGTYSTSIDQNDSAPLYCNAPTAGDKLWVSWQ